MANNALRCGCVMMSDWRLTLDACENHKDTPPQVALGLEIERLKTDLYDTQAEMLTRGQQ